VLYQLLLDEDELFELQQILRIDYSSTRSERVKGILELIGEVMNDNDLEA
jgi:hypothetical protein